MPAPYTCSSFYVARSAVLSVGNKPPGNITLAPEEPFSFTLAALFRPVTIPGMFFTDSFMVVLLVTLPYSVSNEINFPYSFAEVADVKTAIKNGLPKETVELLRTKAKTMIEELGGILKTSLLQVRPQLPKQRVLQTRRQAAILELSTSNFSAAVLRFKSFSELFSLVVFLVGGFSQQLFIDH